MYIVDRSLLTAYLERRRRINQQQPKSRLLGSLCGSREGKNDEK
jgi:hypothetical protein